MINLRPDARRKLEVSMRSVWNGAIRFSLVTFPVKLYSAFDSDKSISFNQLHVDCNGRVAYKKECRMCGESLDKKEDIVKGYEYSKDQYVIVADEDLAALKVESSKSIDIEGFVSIKDLHPTLFDTPYYLGPDGPVAVKTYALFAQTLAETGKVAVGKLVMRGDRETRVVIGPHGSGLILYKMRYPSLMKQLEDVPDVGTEAPKAEELKLAMNLVETMSVDFSTLDVSDAYTDALSEMIQAKVNGQELVRSEVAEEAKPVDIMDALRASIEKAEDLREMERVTKPAKKTAAEKATRPRKQQQA
jgi:DNA end-binding protein Ku